MARLHAATPERGFDTEQIAALLARRARALEAADPTAYAATAVGAQRARDRRSASRIRGLGVHDAGLAVTRVTVRRGRALLDVRSRYRVRGVAGRFGGDRPLIARRTRGGWRVARETGARGRQPWEIGRFERTRSKHFVVLVPSGLEIASLPATLETAYAAMRDVLPSGRLPRRSLVVVAGRTRDAVRLTRGIRGVGSLAAITDSQVREQGRARRAAEVVSQRLLVLWPVFGGLDPGSRPRIATHELTHAALAGVTSGRAPAWLIEGVALYTSGDRRVREAAGERAADTSLSALSRPDRIARLSAARLGDAYAYASAATYYLAGRYGERAALRLYEACNDPGIRGEAGDPRTTDRALRRTLGISLRRLERDLRTWIGAAGVRD